MMNLSKWPTLLWLALAELLGMAVWFGAFAFLALGPATGVWAMYALRSSPAAFKLAGGKR